jgi:hypothetical protein
MARAAGTTCGERSSALLDRALGAGHVPSRNGRARREFALVEIGDVAELNGEFRLLDHCTATERLMGLLERVGLADLAARYRMDG